MDTHNDRDFEKGGADDDGREPGGDPTRVHRTDTAGTTDPGEDHGHGCGSRSSRARHRHHRRHHGRKERVLHTRVSEQLSDDIRRLAEDLRVPASNLVRNVLEEVFAVVENVSDDMGDLFEDLVGEAEAARDRLRERPRPERRHRRRGRSRSRRDFDGDVESELSEDERREAGDPVSGRGEQRPVEAAPPREPEPVFPEVLGWQPLVLNHARSCARCGIELSRGHRGFVGLTANGLSEVTLCRACVGS